MKTKNAALQSYFIREQVIKAVRSFFDKRGFHEVIVPVLNAALPLESNIFSFETDWKTSEGTQNLYLSTSPELGLKKMLAQGIGNCYAIGKCFRNLEGSGPKHNPEFLMLEWYRQDAQYEQIIKDTQELVLNVHTCINEFLERESTLKLSYQGKEIHLDGKWPGISLEELFQKHVDISFTEVLTDLDMQQFAEKKGYSVQGATWSELFDQIFLNEVEPHLPFNPFFLLDFPARVSPLCTAQKSKPYLAERFEFYLAGMEIGNGNNENTDAAKVASQFEIEAKKRQTLGQNSHPIDPQFITSLEKMQHTSYAGIGLGIDRLAMVFADASDISQVEFFSSLLRYT